MLPCELVVNEDSPKIPDSIRTFLEVRGFCWFLTLFVEVCIRTARNEQIGGDVEDLLCIDNIAEVDRMGMEQLCVRQF